MSIPLVSTYERYKDATNQIAQWLLDTASKLGHNAGQKPLTDEKSKVQAEAQNEPKQALPRRLKGKARKQAKQAARCDAPSNEAADNRPIYLITLSEFVELAHSISKKVKGVGSVPAKVLDHIRLTIDMRGDVENLHRNESHTHFIEQLEEVLRLLQPFGERKSSDKQASTRAALVEIGEVLPEGSLSNRFSVLTLENPEEAELDLQSVDAAKAEDRKPSSVNKTSKKAVYHEERADTNYDFAAWCFFSDLHKMQSFVQDTWKGVKEGTIDIISASVINNTAIMLAREADEKFRKQYPDARWMDNVGLGLLRDANLRENPGIDAEAACRMFDSNRPSPEFDQFIYFSTSFSLIFLRYALFDPGRMPGGDLKYYEDFKEVCELVSYGGWSTLKEKINLDRALIANLITYFLVASSLYLDADEEGLGAKTTNLRRVDELLKGAEQFIQTRHPPIWFSFGVELLLDSIHILGLQAGTAFPGLLEMAESSYDKVLRLKKELANSQAIRGDGQVKSILAETEDMFQRFFEGEEQLDKVMPFLAREFHATYHGETQLIYSFQMRMLGVHATSKDNYSIQAAHLYNALRQTGILQTSWPDMELFMEIHTPSDLFFGELPKTFADAAKYFAMKFGRSAVHSAANRRKNVPARVVRRMWAPAPELFVLLFHRGYHDGWSLQDLLKVLQKDRNAKSASTRGNRPCQVSNIDVLNQLKSRLLAGHNDLTFDYLGFRESCKLLLFKLEKELGYATVNEIKESSRRGRHLEIYDMVYELLAFEPSPKVLQRCAEEMRDFFSNKNKIERWLSECGDARRAEDASNRSPTHTGDEYVRSLFEHVSGHWRAIRPRDKTRVNSMPWLSGPWL